MLWFQDEVGSGDFATYSIVGGNTMDTFAVHRTYGWLTFAR